jgi:hypothetical protein
VSNMFSSILQIFKFFRLTLFLKPYFGGGMAPSIQMVGSLLIPHGWLWWLAK